MNEAPSTAAVPQRKVPGKAMVLGKPKKNGQQEVMNNNKDDFLSKPAAGKVVAAAEEESKVQHNPLAENVQVEFEEKISAQINMDGEVEKFDIKGAVFLTINDPKRNKPCVSIDFKSVKGIYFYFRFHFQTPHRGEQVQLEQTKAVDCERL